MKFSFILLFTLISIVCFAQTSIPKSVPQKKGSAPKSVPNRKSKTKSPQKSPSTIFVIKYKPDLRSWKYQVADLNDGQAESSTYEQLLTYRGKLVNTRGEVIITSETLRAALHSSEFHNKLSSFSEEERIENLFDTFVQLVDIENIQSTSNVITEEMLLTKSKDMGVLRIVTDPPGATVKIDGFSGFGTTTLKKWVDKGRRKVDIQMPGFLPVTDYIDIEPLQFHKLEKCLEPMAVK